MRLLVTSAILFTSLMTTTAFAEQWGDLKVRFVFKGNAPDPEALKINVDQKFCGKQGLKDEALVIGEDAGIMNVILYAYDGRGGKDIPAIHPEMQAAKTLTLANDKCRFDPHVVICKKGDTLKVTNPDPVGHNCNLPFLVNAPQNFTIPPGQFKDVDLAAAEPAPIPVACNIHPWMNAKVLVADHPYAAKSDKTGTLEIKNLPAGELAFRVYHEKASRMSGVVIGGQKVNRRNVFEFEIKPGMNDLGTVEIDAGMIR